MTGRELLDTIYIKLESYATNLNDTYNDLVQNDLDEELESSANEIMNEKIVVYDLMYKIPKLEKELDKLTKYKRAFEILKRENVEPFWRCNGYDPENTMEYRVGIGGVWSRRITKEEYELLEELMKGAKD